MEALSTAPTLVTGSGWRILAPKRIQATVAYIEDWFFCLTSACGTMTRRVSSIGKSAMSCPVVVDSKEGRIWYIVSDPRPSSHSPAPLSYTRTRIAEYDVATDQIAYSCYFPEPWEAKWFLGQCDNDRTVVGLLTRCGSPSCISTTDIGSGEYVLRPLPPSTRTVLSLSPCKRYLACLLVRDEIAIVTVDGVEIGRTNGLCNPPLGACFSPDSTALAIGGKPIKRWNMKTNTIDELEFSGMYPYWGKRGKLWYFRNSKTLCCSDSNLGDPQDVVGYGDSASHLHGYDNRISATGQDELILTSISGQRNIQPGDEPLSKKMSRNTFSTFVLETETGDIWPITDRILQGATLFSGVIDFTLPLARNALV
jgi:hypothetical protein